PTSRDPVVDIRVSGGDRLAASRTHRDSCSISMRDILPVPGPVSQLVDRAGSAKPVPRGRQWAVSLQVVGISALSLSGGKATSGQERSRSRSVESEIVGFADAITLP